MNKRNKNRREGSIKPTKGSTIPKTIISIDTETHIIKISSNEEIYPFKLGVMSIVHLNKDATIKTKLVHRFDTIDQCITLLRSVGHKRQTVWVYGHNIGFDARVLRLAHTFNEHGYVSTPPIINERMFIWGVNIEGCTYNFIDTANFAVQSVEQLGNDMGLEKMKVDFHTASNEELYIYCQRDVEVCERFMLTYIKFIYDNQLGSFCPTLASQSLIAYRKRFMEKKIYIHNDDKVIRLERLAYHGGRVECFKYGKQPIENWYYLDVNSMYPYTMKHSVLPRQLIALVRKCSVDKLKQMMKEAYCIADVKLNTDMPVYPYLFLPIDHKEKLKLKTTTQDIRGDVHAKLIFPVGTFRTVLHQPELEYAIAHNHVVSVSNVSIYKSDILFDKYVDFFYDIKVRSTHEGNKSWRYIAKIFQNSLYGKFGQSLVIRTDIGECDKNTVFRKTIGHLQTGVNHTEIGWFGTVYSEDKGGEVTYSFPAIAGSITAYARMLLTKYIDLAEWPNVIYVDTDSLIVNEQGYQNLQEYIDPDKLGFLKLEETSTHAVINNCKDYEFGEHVKMKGVKSSATLTKEGKYRQLQMTGYLAYLNTGAIGDIRGFYIEKGRTGIYNKGIVDDITGIISPFDLDY